MNPLRLLILGDSITAGCVETGVRPENSYPGLLRDAFKRESLDVDVVVSALHGVYVDYALRRFDRMVLRHRPDYAMIFLGANDAGSTDARPAVPPEQYTADLSALIEQCRQNDIQPLVVSPIPCASDRCRHRMTQYADAAREAAGRTDAVFVNLYQAFEKAGGVALLPDGLHPNPQGNIAIAISLAVVLTPMLQMARSESVAS